MTTAQQISAQLDDDGQQWETADGVDLDYLCKAKRADRSYRDGHGTSTYRYSFDDGSAIVIDGAGWDLAPDNCKRFCWAGEGCQCKHCIKCSALVTDSQITGPERCIDCADID